MHSMYFVSDFGYDPQRENPLKVYELGDAFTAGWTSQPIIKNKKKIQLYDSFILDLQK